MSLMPKLISFILFLKRNKRLRKKEFKTFRRSVKRLARNKGCAKNFWKYCDKDENGEMTKDEWNACLGTNELKDCKILCCCFYYLSFYDNTNTDTNSY